jgi:hypothetical protein
LTVVAQSLEYEKQYNLVKKIIHQLELTSLEAQKVASKIYKILKETESNKNTINGYNKPWRFSDIVVCYKGKNNNLIEDNNIKEFCRNLDSKSLSQEIYRNILKEKISEDGKIVYGIHTDPQTKHIYTDLLLHSNKYNQDGDHGQDDDHKNDIYNNKEEVKNGGKDNQIDSSSKNNAQINKADNGQILYDYESNLSGLDAEVNPQDIIYYKQ